MDNDDMKRIIQKIDDYIDSLEHLKIIDLELYNKVGGDDNVNNLKTHSARWKESLK